MNRMFSILIFCVCAGLPLAAGAQAVGEWGPPGGSCPVCSNCSAERSAGYQDGRNQAIAQCMADPASCGILPYQQCVADPASCGITLSSCIPAPEYGEVEPNEYMGSANRLQSGISVWGQSRDAADEDWFRVTTSVINQNLIVNFASPGMTGTPAGWTLSIRDAFGNEIAKFDTVQPSAFAADAGAATYRTTLGLIGDYYIVVKAAVATAALPIYEITALLQNTTLEDDPSTGGYYRVEMESNDGPSLATPLPNSLAMYGVVNLSFNVPIPVGESYVWGQGDPDWYVYHSVGNEIVTLTFCAREKCGDGSWFVQVFDLPTAARLEAGEPEQNLVPLLAFNTKDSTSQTYRLGLKYDGYYFMRIDHKRKVEAPCLQSQFVSSTSRSGFGGVCDCPEGDTCNIPVNCDTAGNPACIDTQPVATEKCIPGIDPGCQSYPEGCGTEVDETGNPLVPCSYYLTQARCTCAVFGGVVEIPEGLITSPYNFTWYPSPLPPDAVDTGIYQDFLNRPNPNVMP